MRNGIDEFTLLCEKCGYVIEGLARDGQCPECGKPVLESLPERRTREPWHQIRPLSQQIGSAVRTIMNPWTVTRDLRISQTRLFPFWLIFGLATIACLPLFMPLMSRPASADGLAIWVWLTIYGVIPSAAVGLGVAIVAAIATWTESVGIRTIGRGHGYRGTTAIAKSACSSATIGWVVGIVLYAVAVRAFISIELILRESTVRHVYWQDLRTRAGLWSLIAILPGFLIFESLAYVGLRQCKFANRERPEDQTN